MPPAPATDLECLLVCLNGHRNGLVRGCLLQRHLAVLRHVLVAVNGDHAAAQLVAVAHTLTGMVRIVLLRV
jgi:hypothetical protein